MKLSRILCAVDFSAPAQAAFRQALALSRARDAELALVIAVPVNGRSGKKTTDIAALRRAAGAAGVRTTVSVQHGDPVSVILRHANSMACDLIVLGTHNRTGFARLRSGSVAEQVARRATSPVLVVPVPTPGTDRELDGSFANVLCPIDFSEVSRSALERALRIVHETSGRLTLVHVLPNLDPMTRYGYYVAHSDYGPPLERDAWQRLQEYVPSEMKASIDVRARVVSGVPAEQIARVSREIDADLVVMGVTARGAIGRRLLGSTAVRVMRSAGRPILVIPERVHQGSAVDAVGGALTTMSGDPGIVQRI